MTVVERVLVAAPNCQATPPAGNCYWAPAPVPIRAWWIFAAIVVFAALVIYGLEGGRPKLRLVAVWLGSMIVFALTAAALEFYAAAAALR
ncbi:MAG TPA: hypothetical protein VNA65_07385 [Candidatus Dormibacteraeota bacterium]|nr:hypothetical protein [Candidatus Dormibacteraeota bacterium]